jgi:hypothetical protein
MKTFLHVLNTWLLSILVMLPLAIGYERYLDGDFYALYDPELVLVLLVCLVTAIPSFFISWIFLAIIRRAFYTIYEKLFLWLLAAIVSIVLNIFILLLVFGEVTISPEIFFLFWPAYAAVIVTILLRLKQFFSLINKTIEHETNLV